LGRGITLREDPSSSTLFANQTSFLLSASFGKVTCILVQDDYIYLGFMNGNIMQINLNLSTATQTIVNWNQYNIDFKPKPITTLDVIDAGTKFILVGD
jgi:hypothetical protein